MVARSLFVYWKTPRATLDAAAAAVAAAQHDLVARHPGLQARLYRRADAGDSGSGAALATLMETYARVGGIDDALARAIGAVAERAGTAYRQGPRHVEVFEDWPA